MDLLPGASLELRVYVILGAIGIMFFASILALGLGRLGAMRNSSNLGDLAEPSSPFGVRQEKEPKPGKVKKEKLAKPGKARNVTDILEEDEEEFVEVEPREQKTKKSFFSKKKKDAVEMLSAPSGYVEEYAPVHTRDLDSRNMPDLVEYDAESEYSSKPANSLSKSDSKKDLEDEWSNDFSEDTPLPTDEPKKKRNDSNSPFGGADDWEF
jgi:hypothetical protein